MGAARVLAREDAVEAVSDLVTGGLDGGETKGRDEGVYELREASFEPTMSVIWRLRPSSSIASRSVARVQLRFSSSGVRSTLSGCEKRHDSRTSCLTELGAASVSSTMKSIAGSFRTGPSYAYPNAIETAARDVGVGLGESEERRKVELESSTGELSMIVGRSAEPNGSPASCDDRRLLPEMRRPLGDQVPSSPSSALSKHSLPLPPEGLSGSLLSRRSGENERATPYAVGRSERSSSLSLSGSVSSASVTGASEIDPNTTPIPERRLDMRRWRAHSSGSGSLSLRCCRLDDDATSGPADQPPGIRPASIWSTSASDRLSRTDMNVAG